MMKKHAIVLALALAGSGSAAFWFHYTSPKMVAERACVTALKYLMKSPSSFSVTRTSSFENGSVFVDYESANSFGVQIAGVAACKMKMPLDPKDPRLEHLSVNGEDYTSRGNIGLIMER